MTEKVGKPTDAKPDEWQKDLNPKAMAGNNHGLEGDHPEKTGATRNAHEIKDLHRMLSDFSDDELKQISVLPPGTRLEQGATYLDLSEADPKPFTAMGAMEADENNSYVAKTAVDYELWNRLTGVTNPERLNEANA